MGLDLLRFEASTADGLDQALASIPARRVQALMVSAGLLFLTYRKRIVDFCAQNRIPAVYTYAEAVADGGLFSYSSSVTEGWRKAATYVQRILNGAKPADLPVEQPTQLELVVNLKTAKALGITIPQSVLLRADRVIE